MYDFYLTLAATESAGLTPSAEDKAYARKVDAEFDEAMDDDFNTSLALGNLFGYFREIRKFLSEKDGRAAALAAQVRESYALLGLFRKDAAEYVRWYETKDAAEIPEEVRAVAEERWAARACKDWAKSDELRARLAEMGYSVKDSKTGYELTKN